MTNFLNNVLKEIVHYLKNSSYAGEIKLLDDYTYINYPWKG